MLKRELLINGELVDIEESLIVDPSCLKDCYEDMPREDGKYHPDEVKLEKLEKLEKQKVSKEQKIKELDTLAVSLNSVSYDANMEAIGNMGAVIGGLTFKVLKALAQEDEKVKKLYDEVFDQSIKWKGADNKIHTVKIESVAQVLEKAINEKAQVLYKY